MLFLFADRIPLFIPAIFPSKEIFFTWPSLYLLYYTEVTAIMLMCPGALLLFYALKKTVRFLHGNLIRVAQAHLIALTISQCMRILIFLYDVEIVQRNDSVNRLLYVLFFMRFVPLCTMLTIIPAIVAERLLASRYISDYEHQCELKLAYLDDNRKKKGWGG
ncbi:unnamed protein product [Cylicocyclus nassatus]|uniref:Uncharacterized protein n=1 Tax=Cylicocyclus nassatus TaxID=53992 RepID=A0AA36MEY3_CYLNA|nr:unnamed protein product [Cylicocyclus nassatus]